MRSGPRSRALAVLALASVVLWLGCGGGADLTGPPTGSLRLTIATDGSEPDADGYVVRIDGGAPEVIGANTSRVVEGLSAGTHGIDLSGLASRAHK